MNMKPIKLSGVNPQKLSIFLSNFTKTDMHTPLLITGDKIVCNASNHTKTIIISVSETGIWEKNSAGDTPILICTNTMLIKKINKALATFVNISAEHINITITPEDYQGELIGIKMNFVGEKFSTRISSIEYDFINKIPPTVMENLLSVDGETIGEFSLTAEMLYIVDRVSTKKDDDYSASFSITKKDDNLVLASVGTDDWEVLGKYDKFTSQEKYTTGLLFTKILPKGVDYTGKIFMSSVGTTLLVLQNESSTYICPLLTND